MLPVTFMITRFVFNMTIIRMGMVGGGQGTFIGAVHRLAAFWMGK